MFKDLKPLACGHHSHTDFSLDGGTSVANKLKYAASIGRIADCVTDHGIMSALIPHWMTAKKMADDKDKPVKIKSIHGIEAYIIDPHRPHKPNRSGVLEPQYYHLTIHFKTLKAYQYFCQLSPLMESRAIYRYGEAKPLMTFEELEQIAGDVVISSGCLLGPIQKNVLAGRSDLAIKMYEYLRGIAGPGNFFVEIFPHIIDREWKRPVFEKRTMIQPGEFVPAVQKMDSDAIDKPFPADECTGCVDIQKYPNLFVLDLAKKYKDDVVISLDDHYGPASDRVVQESRLSNGTEGWRFYGQYSAMTSEEAAINLHKQLSVSKRDIEGWIDNSYKFVDLFNDYKVLTSKDRWLVPSAEMVYNVKIPDTKQKFWELVEFHGRMPKIDDPRYQTYKERADYELSVLTENKQNLDFLPYFFVLEDAVRYAKSKGILNTCRGSAGGCLLVYLLGISMTDPIKYDLPFERFMTLGRLNSGSLPDIDTDWEDRQVILQYLFKKYGDKMSLISTETLLKVKSSILDVERSFLGSVRVETAKMTAMMPAADQGMSDKDFLFGYKDKTTGAMVPGFLETKDPAAIDLNNWIKTNPEMWNVVQRCLGICKTRGVHAGGVILTPDSIANHTPIIQSEYGAVSALNMKFAEAVGLIKYDFLGVSTLKAMSISLKLIAKRHKSLEWGEFAEDERVYTEIFDKDLVEALFQVSGGAVRSVATKIKPRSIKQIALWISLMRPGAMDSPSPDPKDPATETAATYYVKCAQGLRTPYYIHEDLIPILGDTYGVIVTQEQALKLFRDLADYTYETAEDVRRGIGKKDKALMDKHVGVLKGKLLERNWTEEQAQRLADSIIASARYSFNCLSADQTVQTDKGCIRVDDLAKNPTQKVAFLDKNDTIQYAIPTNVIKTGYKEVYELELSNGSVIKLTGDHRILSNDRWVTVQEAIDNDLEIDWYETENHM